MKHAKRAALGAAIAASLALALPVDAFAQAAGVAPPQVGTVTNRGFEFPAKVVRANAERGTVVLDDGRTYSFDPTVVHVPELVPGQTVWMVLNWAHNQVLGIEPPR